MISERDTPDIKANEVKLFLNGNSSFWLLMKLSKTLQMSDIESLAREKWRRKLKNPRLFTSEGVELFQDDLPFLKPGRTFYVSRGEDFDQFSCFSEYDLTEKLGEGGFGKVYLGIHKQTKQKVAIKIINSGLVRNAQEIELVFREAEALVNLNHANIVKILNFYTIKNMQVAIIMEYLQGGELLKYVEERKKLQEDEARGFFLQLLDAMSYCHRQKIIHRDLKLENILISDVNAKTIKVVDFGISSLLANSNIETINAGTLKYMAPELFHKKADNAFGIDVWAMGCILYAMVNGRLPFQGESRKSIRDKIVGEKVKFPSENEISKEIKHLIRKMLEKDPRKRISLGDIYHHPWTKKEEMIEEKENVEEIEEKKTVIQKPLPVSNEKEQRKSLTHAKRNSACMKIMTSKENEQVIETPKLYESLIRGGKQSLLENKSNERK